MAQGNGKDHLVTTLEQLEALYAEPLPALRSSRRSTTSTPHYRAFIEAAPFVALATSGPEGLDCSPRGDPPGFVRVLDEKTLLIPDRRGNNRIDSLRNIVRDPRVALLFLIPGVGETMRVIGRAAISTDPELTASFVMNGKTPTLRASWSTVEQRLLPVHQGDRALEAVGPGAACRSQEPAERRHDPRRDHRGQDRRPGARPAGAGAHQGNDLLSLVGSKRAGSRSTA